MWAQKESGISTNSNLYIARMNGATAISGRQVRIAVPTLSWEKEGYAVNEGPQIVKKNGTIFIAYSAAATDARYKLGLLTASDTANLLDPASWSKNLDPVFTTADGASTASNADVGLNRCNGSTAQQWGIRDRTGGWFQLYNVAGKTCLDNDSSDSVNGARISLYPCNTSTAQLWRRG